MADDIVYKDKGLRNLIKALEGKLPVARVGILGGKTNRGDSSGETNAEIGARHEFGTDKLPIRSFLRFPISEYMQKYLNQSKAFTESVLEEVIDEASIKAWVKKIAIVAESIVSDAFDSGGFGKWKPSNMEGKKNQQTLVETTQLRNSITSEVK